MNHLKALVASTALAFCFALPSAHAQPVQNDGPVDCVVQFVTCLATGGGVTCVVALAKCLSTGGSSTSMLDRRER